MVSNAVIVSIRPCFKVLRVHAILFLTGCIVFTILNYAQLSEGEGWGVAGMIGLAGFGIFLLILEVIICNIFKKQEDGEYYWINHIDWGDTCTYVH
jgi:hypothetical protein